MEETELLIVKVRKNDPMYHTSSSLLRNKTKKKVTCNTIAEEINMTNEGFYTEYVALVSGLASFGAVCSIQSMYFILPSVSCEIELAPAEKAFLGSVTFLGNVILSNFFDFLADLYGRKNLLLISIFGTVIFSILISLSPDAVSLILTSLCNGLMLGGVFGLSFVYLSEFCSSKIRSKYVKIATALLMLANVYSPCVAWLVTWLDYHIKLTDRFIFSPWRQYILLNVFPILVAAVMILFLPESPKYLLFSGKNGEAIRILSSYYEGRTRKPTVPYQNENINLDPDDDFKIMNTSQRCGLIEFFFRIFAQIKELFTPPLLLYTCISSLLMFGSVGLYSIVLLWTPDQANKIMQHLDTNGNQKVTFCEVVSNQNTTRSKIECHVDHKMYLICILIGLASFISSILIVLLDQKLKAKIVIGICTLISSILCLLIIFLESIYGTIISLGIMVALLASDIPLGVSYIDGCFSSSMRGTATSVALFFARISVPIGSALLAVAFESHCLSVYYCIGALLAAIGVISFLIPPEKSPSNE